MSDAPKSWSAMSSGHYLSAADLDGEDLTLTIASYEQRDFEKERERDAPKDAPAQFEKRWVIWFTEEERGLTVNETNRQLLSYLWDSPADAIGHRITLTTEDVQYQGRPVGGIRIKGSPDITAPIQATISLPKRKDTVRDLVPTGRPTADELAMPILDEQKDAILGYAFVAEISDEELDARIKAAFHSKAMLSTLTRRQAAQIAKGLKSAAERKRAEDAAKTSDDSAGV